MSREPDNLDDDFLFDIIREAVAVELAIGGLRRIMGEGSVVHGDMIEAVEHLAGEHAFRLLRLQQRLDGAEAKAARQKTPSQQPKVRKKKAPAPAR